MRQHQPDETTQKMERCSAWGSRTYLTRNAHGCASTCCTHIFHTIFYLHENEYYLCACVHESVHARVVFAHKEGARPLCPTHLLLISFSRSHTRKVCSSAAVWQAESLDSSGPRQEQAPTRTRLGMAWSVWGLRPGSRGCREQSSSRDS